MITRKGTSKPKGPPITVFVAAASLLYLAPLTARAATPAQVDTAMKKAVDLLYAQEANGNWEHSQTRVPEIGAGGENGRQWTGLTALSTYALLCTGESEADKRLSSAIQFLAANPSQGVYSSAVRCLVWSRIKLTPPLHAAAQKDVDFLLKAVHAAGEGKGLFYYALPTGPTDPTYDNSTSQMGALGLSVMAPAGFEIPQEFWRLTEQGWHRHQLADGGWSYNSTTGVTSMTAAGAATLYAAQAMLNDKTDCKGNADDPHIDKALNWLANNFDATFIPARETGGLHLEEYALFAVSRVGVASGLRYFGKEDWYNRGADYLVTTQLPNGSWVSDRVGSTALGLLFLAYGSSPVVLDKLEYTLPPEPGQTPVARWNQRPQDLLNFVDWMGHRLETRLNWQVVDFSSTSQALHDAPILVISGSQPLNFSEDEGAKLRQFVEEGGMIVGNADCDSGNFTESFLKLGRELFPAYAFRELPASHPIYTNEQYRTAKFRHPAHMQGLSNGVRELMLLPAGDPSRSFQRRNETTQPDAYQLYDDIVLYAMDTSGLERKGNSYLVQEDPAAPIAQTIKLARLQYDGNWDPEPGGWRRLTAVMHNSQKTALQVETVKLGDGKLSQRPAEAAVPAPRPTLPEIRQTAMKRITPDQLLSTGGDPAKLQAMVDLKVKDVEAELDAAEAKRLAALATYKLAHLTGTDQLKLTDAQRQELKKFVEAGGTLIIDAAGGSTEFAASAEQMLRDTFGADAASLNEPLAPDAPIYRLKDHAVDSVHYRNFAKSRMSSTQMPQLRGIQINGRLAVIYSREDLSAGLVGEPVDGITGYTPASATELMTNVILYAGGRGKY